jgi:hypothetical protein
VSYKVLDVEEPLSVESTLETDGIDSAWLTDVDVLFMLLDDLSCEEMALASKLVCSEAAPCLKIAIASTLPTLEQFKTSIISEQRSLPCVLLNLQSTQADSLTAIGYLDRLAIAIGAIARLLLEQGIACVDCVDIRCVLAPPGVVQFACVYADCVESAEALVLAAILKLPDGLSSAASARGVLVCLEEGDSPISMSFFSSVLDELENCLPADCVFLAGARSGDALSRRVRVALYLV